MSKVLINKIKNSNIKGFKDKLKVIADDNNKNYYGIFFKYCCLYVIKGFGLNDYLNYKLYNRNWNEIKKYASIKDQDKFYEIVSPSLYKNSFSDKSNFMAIFKNFVKRDFISKKNTYEEFTKFLNNHEEIIVKPIDGLGGHNISKLLTKNIKNTMNFWEEVKKNNYLLEELVVQHPEMASLSRKSVNTLRVMTANINNKTEIIFMCLRIGNGISYVDNFHQGGMAVNIDIKNGIICSNAIDKDLNKYEYHPHSKKKFIGFAIPYFNEIKDLVINASKVVPEIQVVGWDIAITKKGPLIIEGNRRPGFDIVQVLSNRGRMEIIRDIYSKLKK